MATMFNHFGNEKVPVAWERKEVEGGDTETDRCRQIIAPPIILSSFCIFIIHIHLVGHWLLNFQIFKF